MLKTSIAIVAIAAAHLLPAGFAHASDEGYRDARELIAKEFLGVWEADLDQSSFEGNAPLRALRTFQFTEEGKVLVTFMTWPSNGNFSMGHWAAQTDGTPGIEYHIRAGSIPYNTIELTATDERSLDLRVLRHGEESLAATYELSEDGETLNYSYGQTTIVYNKL
ncbi:hypothetical protein [Mesorhizobium sp. CAU 1732]|uniref:hypothetical protein n=1 Tax=Mesorhizobium sp. CAU 1732 TaxID=3140358 RepID=UPI0032605822